MKRTTTFVPTERTTLKRLPKRASYERNTIYQILDEGFVCQVGFTVNGQPVVIPTAYGRAEDTLYIHESVASRMLRTLANGIQVCVTVTLLDGLVLARSAFHHSMNYRSVVVFGAASVVEDAMEKARALRTFSEHVIPGRWAEVREPNEDELKKTLVLRIPLTEASAKVRSGPPIDEEADYTLPVWAGELPLRWSPERRLVIPDFYNTCKRPPISETTRFKAVAQSYRDGLATAIGKRRRYPGVGGTYPDFRESTSGSSLLGSADGSGAGHGVSCG